MKISYRNCQQNELQCEKQYIHLIRDVCVCANNSSQDNNIPKI